MTHELKTWPVYFQAVKSGKKTFELRKDDRPYQVGDFLWLKEWNPNSEQYTGDELTMQVTYLFKDYVGHFGLSANYCIMGIKPIS